MSSTFSRPTSASLRIHTGGWAAAAVFTLCAACSKETPQMQAPQVTQSHTTSSVTAFGTTSSDAVALPGYDFLLQAMGGLMAIVFLGVVLVVWKGPEAKGISFRKAG